MIRGDAAAQTRWATRMNATAAALRRRLWRADRGACFDRERDGNHSFVETLVHNNLRAMWHGAFSQEMADTFVAQHLMNRSEFYTATPLPSISAADLRFRDPTASNDWSGPPEGLTFQRTLRALESYGHHAELLLIGAAQRAALLPELRFSQQIDPFTSVPSSHGHCYGPMLLSFLEYTARTTGIAICAEANSVLWTSAGDHDVAFNFSQILGDAVLTLRAEGEGRRFRGLRNRKLLFECTGSTRVVTDPAGAVVSIVGVSPTPQRVRLVVAGTKKTIDITVGPNEEWSVRGGAPSLTRRVPYRGPV